MNDDNRLITVIRPIIPLCLCLILLSSCSESSEKHSFSDQSTKNSQEIVEIRSSLDRLEANLVDLNAKNHDPTRKLVDLERSNAFLKGIFISGVVISLIAGIAMGTNTRKLAESHTENSMNEPETDSTTASTPR